MNSNHDKLCEVCSEQLTGLQRKYCSRKCHNKSSNVVKQTYESQQKRALLRKKHLISLKGGKCQRCGYNRNLAALCFHHSDPSAKERKLDSRSLSSGKWELLLLEAGKCELLCHNCHMELHHNSQRYVLG